MTARFCQAQLSPENQIFQFSVLARSPGHVNSTRLQTIKDDICRFLISASFQSTFHHETAKSKITFILQCPSLSRCTTNLFNSRLNKNSILIEFRSNVSRDETNTFSVRSRRIQLNMRRANEINPFDNLPMMKSCFQKSSFHLIIICSSM